MLKWGERNDEACKKVKLDCVSILSNIQIVYQYQPLILHAIFSLSHVSQKALGTDRQWQQQLNPKPVLAPKKIGKKNSLS